MPERDRALHLGQSEMIQDARDGEESSQGKKRVLQTRPQNQDIPRRVAQRFHDSMLQKSAFLSQEGN